MSSTAPGSKATSRVAGNEDARGRDAEHPGEIPVRGWLDVAQRVRTQIREDKVLLLSAGVAFYLLLALAPALIAIVTVYGLVADPADIEQQLSPVFEAMPQQAASLVRDQLQTIAGTSARGLGLGLVLSLAGTLWAASSGMQGLVKAVNAAYDETETRGFLRLRALALLLTLAGIVFGAVTVGLVAVLPAALGAIGLGSAGEAAVRWGRWPLLALLVIVALAAVYRYAPDRASPRWSWVSSGAVIAMVLWLAGSAVFSFYVSNFGNYNETYGSLGGVVILMLWLLLTSFVVLLGAEINAEAEHQTRRDTTSGESSPMGRRQAEVADSLGESRN